MRLRLKLDFARNVVFFDVADRSSKFGQVEPTIENDFKVRCPVSLMNCDRTAFGFAAIAVVLTSNCRRAQTTLRGFWFIKGASRVVVLIIASDNLLASISHLLLISLNRFEEPL